MKSKLISGMLIIAVVLASSGCIGNDNTIKIKEYKIVQILSEDSLYRVFFSDGNTTYDKLIYKYKDDHYNYIIFSNKTKFIEENSEGFGGHTYILYLNESDLNSKGVYTSGYRTGD